MLYDLRLVNKELRTNNKVNFALLLSLLKEIPVYKDSTMILTFQK